MDFDKKIIEKTMTKFQKYYDILSYGFAIMIKFYHNMTKRF